MDHQHFSTKERILNAAEDLFARAGFAGASLRQVTASANVNLAAVNYHFGSKENLINELFKRRLDELTVQRMKALEQVRQSNSVTLEAVLMAFVSPALMLAQDRSGGPSFVRLLARAFAEQDQKLRRFVSDNYGYILKEFAKSIAALLPSLGKEELYWRFDFISGALTYLMSDFGIVKRPPAVSEELHRKNAAAQFVRFAAAGLRAT